MYRAPQRKHRVLIFMNQFNSNVAYVSETPTRVKLAICFDWLVGISFDKSCHEMIFANRPIITLEINQLILLIIFQRVQRLLKLINLLLLLIKDRARFQYLYIYVS